jgi:hypothetical protein
MGNGKGDKQRPIQITHEEWRRRHSDTFAKRAREQEQKLKEGSNDRRAKN